MMGSLLWLSVIVFLPALSVLVLPLLPRDRPDVARVFTVAVTGAVLLLCIWQFLMPGSSVYFDRDLEYMQSVCNVPWVPSFNIEYFMGVDGISFPLVMLTALVTFLAAGASWSVTKYVKTYCALLLILETGMIGVFFALDFFLFYVFWEVMLLPMYFLIGVWGGPRREYAAIKFFLYTLLGGVLMLIALLILYFSSDMRDLSRAELASQGTPQAFSWPALHVSPRVNASLARGVLSDNTVGIVFLRGSQHADRPLKISIIPAAGAEPGVKTEATFDESAGALKVVLAPGENHAADVVTAVRANAALAELVTVGLADPSGGAATLSRPLSGELPAFNPHLTVHTFNMLAMAAMGQHTTLFSTPFLGRSLQWWAFLLLFIGFVIKVPSVPLHTWLPDAHVEAPTPISMILAGVLLKMGGYGIIRICYPICPQGGYQLAYLVCLVGVVSMLYGAYAALAQRDFKRMVAYSSVSHMGYVVLGLGVWSMANSSYWNMGIQGAMFQMIAHGISSSGMFFLVGVVYDRVHHRNLNEFGGLFGRMPVYTALSIGIFFAGLGLPGLCGFIGEVLVTLSVWNYSKVLAVLAAFVVILTASYILWAIQRVYLGAEYRGPHEEALVPSTPRENAIAGVLFTLAILLGVFPNTFVLRYMNRTIDRQVRDLTVWSQYTPGEAVAGATRPGPSSPQYAAASDDEALP